MFGKKKHKVTPFKAIAGDKLEWVIGGRLIPRTGPNPEVLSGIKTLAETVGQAGQVIQQKNAEQQGMMQQVMQQMMQGRGGR